jgi:hypothetical protein
MGNTQTVVMADRPGPSSEVVQGLRTLTQAFGRDPWIGPWTPFRMTSLGNVAWVGRFDGKFRPVFDDEVGPEFDALIACQIQESAVNWWGQRDATVYRIERSIDLARADEPALADGVRL